MIVKLPTRLFVSLGFDLFDKISNSSKLVHPIEQNISENCKIESSVKAHMPTLDCT